MQTRSPNSGSQQICDTELGYLDSKVEDSEESDLEQVERFERILTKGK